MNTNKNISIVIPFLNEGDIINELYIRLTRATSSLPERFEFIFVDDGSVDDTFEKLLCLRGNDARVKIIKFTRSFGQQTALTAGLDYAEGDAVLTMDADLQHPPELIPMFIRLWKQGNPIVCGVRSPESPNSLFKKSAIFLYYRFFQIISGLSIPINAPEFRLMDRKVLLTFRNFRERHRFIRGLTHWMGFKTHPIPFSAPPRSKGKSRINVSQMISTGIDGIISFSSRPLYFAIHAGMFSALAGMVYAFYVLYARFVTHDVIPGWTSLVLISLILGGIQLFFMGVMGLYIGKMFEEIKSRPLYIVQELHGFAPRNFPAALPPLSV